MDYELFERNHINELYDVYGSLLTSKQKDTLELYFEEDLSLAEISQHMNTSRQAVHNNLLRAKNSLERYESKLHILKKANALDNCISYLEKIATKEQPSKHDIEFVLSMLTTIRKEDACGI